jgi:NADH dehydrogenase
VAREAGGADAFVNTYWIRLPHGGQDFATAVESSRRLLEGAARARVGRLVHVSVSNADRAPDLGYFAGKAAVDDAVRGSGLSHAIVRPTLVVGRADVLTSNVAWLLRRMPLFLAPSGGEHRVQPVTLADTGRIVADAIEAPGDLDLDAAGPEVYAFGEYVRLLARAVGVRRAIVRAPPGVGLGLLRALGVLLGDVVLAREELEALSRDLLVSSKPPLGRESVAEWLRRHGRSLGLSYVNDLRRHFGAGRTAAVGAA